MNNMKIGDTVIMSGRNKNHLNNDVCAYSGMKGTVIEIYDDNAFSLDCGSCTLVVPLVIYGRVKGVWIYLNDKLIYHKGKKINYNTNINDKTKTNSIWNNILKKLLN